MIIQGSNIKNGRQAILKSLSGIHNGVAQRDKILCGTGGIHSVSLHNVNGFRGLVIYDEKTDMHVLVAAMTHKEYDKVIHDPQKIQAYQAAIASGDYKHIQHDEKTRFKNAYDQAPALKHIINMARHNANLMTEEIMETTSYTHYKYNQKFDNL